MSDKITVKPLVWKQLYEGSTMYPMEWNGVGAFSSVVYRVGQHWKGSGYYSVGNCFDTLEEAQAAAQTDYEQRILSAIEASALTASQEEVKRLSERYEALEAEFDQMAAECFEVVSTTDVDKDGNNIERRVPKHHLLSSDVTRISAENYRLREALMYAQAEINSKPLAKGHGLERDLWLRGVIRNALDKGEGK